MSSALLRKVVKPDSTLRESELFYKVGSSQPSFTSRRGDNLKFNSTQCEPERPAVSSVISWISLSLSLLSSWPTHIKGLFVYPGAGGEMVITSGMSTLSNNTVNHG